MSIFHRVERHSGERPEIPEEVVISFKTEYRGIWQCSWYTDGMSELKNEPPFESLKGEEQKAIREIGPYIFYTTFGEIPKYLSESDT